MSKPDFNERSMRIDALHERRNEELTTELEARWAAESEERIDAVNRGELRTVDGPSVLRELRSSLRK